MHPFVPTTFKHSFASHMVLLEKMRGLQTLEAPPRVGDLVAAQVVVLGRHTSLELRNGMSSHIFPGDRITAVFGNCYAADQFEGYLPLGPVRECDLLSAGGVCGEVVSSHAAMGPPTLLKLLGAVCDEEGRPINTRGHGLSARPAIQNQAQIILVVGSSTSSGKTTMAGALVRALTLAGRRVAAAKVTGTAGGTETRYYASCGAAPVLDFSHAGFPSTYMLETHELLMIYQSLVAQLRAANPEYILVEIADGILQRETRMLLASELIRTSVDHVFFTAGDSLSTDYGVRVLREAGLPVRATGGMITLSPLMSREAESVTGLHCLGSDQIISGEALALLGNMQSQNRHWELERVA